MLLEEFRDVLAALPLYAPVEVRDQTGSRTAIDAVEYNGGVVQISVETDTDDDELDDDEDDGPGVAYLSTFRHRARMFGHGCGFGYPLCCVLFFVLVWWPVSGWKHTLARRMCAFWVPGPVAYIPCPWHRWHRTRPVLEGRRDRVSDPH